MRLKVEAAGFLRGLELLHAGIIGANAQAMRLAIHAAESSGKATTLFKDRSGTTRSKIRGSYEGSGRGLVVFGGVARLLESGTRPHTILGRPMLRFVVAGEVLFRRMVKHPGTAPRPFVTEARARGEETLLLATRQLVDAAVRRV